jgi:hypothetical protein
MGVEEEGKERTCIWCEPWMVVSFGHRKMGKGGEGIKCLVAHITPPPNPHHHSTSSSVSQFLIWSLAPAHHQGGTKNAFWGQNCPGEEPWSLAKSKLSLCFPGSAVSPCLKPFTKAKVWLVSAPSPRAHSCRTAGSRFAQWLILRQRPFLHTALTFLTQGTSSTLASKALGTLWPNLGPNRNQSTVERFWIPQAPGSCGDTKPWC